MSSECNHYYVENFRHGSYDKRFFDCIFCNAPTVLKQHNKLMNFRESEPSRAWARLLSAEISKTG